MMKILAICRNNLEKECAAEVTEITSIKAKAVKGGAEAEIKDPKTIVKLIYRTQSAHKVMLLLQSKDKTNVAEFIKEINNMDLKKYTEDKSFRVRCMHWEKTEIDSPKIEKEVGKHIFENNKTKADLENPDIPFLLYESSDSYYFGIDLSRSDISKRPYNIFVNPGAIKATLSYTILKMSGYKKGEVLIDPYCRSGITCIEAALYMSGLSPLFFNKEKIRLPKIKEFEFDAEKIFEEIDSKVKNPKKNTINAFDPKMPNIKAAEKNAKIAGVNKTINFSRTDISWLDTKFDKEEVDRIVSVLPNTSKTMTKTDVEKIYKELFYQAEFVLRKNGSICVMSKEEDMIKQYTDMYKLNISEKRDITVGSDDISLFLITRKK